MVDLQNPEELLSLRHLFPILSKCVYLISNSLGAVPSQVEADLVSFFRDWAEKGVGAWQEKWWDLPNMVGRKMSLLLGAGAGDITMLPNATVAHWVALSTLFRGSQEGRNKILMTDHDFPSSIYAVSEIARFMDWHVEIIPSHGHPGIDVESLLDRIDDDTLCVATSHVYFKSGYLQDVYAIATKAQRVGSFTLIDGYHAPGIIPVNLKELGVDFYVGGCLKWLCGGPGNAFLYVRDELRSKIEPLLTGWFAHKNPFEFSLEMDYSNENYRFMAGTPSIPCLYTASAGLDIISQIGLAQIRKKSLSQTDLIIERSKARRYAIYSSEEADTRGGAISIAVPHGYQVKQALDRRQIIVDFRKGTGREPDILRVGPHFYSKDEEVDVFFEALDQIYANEEYKKYSETFKSVT